MNAITRRLSAKMNLLFKRKLVYTPQLPAEQVEYKLHYICNRRFDDFSVDLVGYVKPDGSFELTNKWGFTEKRWIENREAYLQGGIRQQGEQAAVEVKLRPNIIFIILFYLGVLLLTLELCSIKLLPVATREIRLVVLSIFMVVVTVLIVRATNTLRGRFERLMQLN